ncbi:hypothetical protein ACTHRH_18100 [Paenibacillus sp. SAFN-117]
MFRRKGKAARGRRRLGTKRTRSYIPRRTGPYWQGYQLGYRQGFDEGAAQGMAEGAEGLQASA